MKREEFFKKAFVGFWGLRTSFKRPFSLEKNSNSWNIKTSLNGYSFNSYLKSEKMNLDGLIEYCSKLPFDAIDPTGYYFPGYPEVPNDEYIYHIKQKAFKNGLAISGTGIRNNFINPDHKERAKDLELTKKWIKVASKLGAPVIRVFAAGGGNGYQSNFSKNTNKRLVESLQTCAEYGRSHGVMIGLQNHNNYLKNADQVLEIIKSVDSDWFGIILDVGSFATDDPYKDIARVAPHAISWQIKENLGYKNRVVKTDLSKIVKILKDINYRGYIPIETLGGDPVKKVPKFLNQVIGALS